MPELMQKELTGERLAEELKKLLDKKQNEAVQRRLKEATKRLGEGGASGRAAKVILRTVRSWKEKNESKE